MKIYFAKYSNTYKSSLNSRSESSLAEGVLVKYEKDGQQGYSSFNIIEGLESSALSEHLESAKTGKFTPEMQLALKYAEQDAQSRRMGHDDLAGAFQIKNHYLVVNPVNLTADLIRQKKEEGFEFIKVKMGRDLEVETNALFAIKSNLKTHNLRLRLDFNNSLSLSQFTDWINENQSWLKAVIEFYEDPFEYDCATWGRLQNEMGLPLALDCWHTQAENVDYSGAKFLILKPARMNAIEWLKKLIEPNKYLFVVTHFMDHPVGIATAAAVASKLKFFVKDRLVTCGLLPPSDIEYGEWSLNPRGPFILFDEGLGVGFDERLEAQEWKLIYEN